MTTNELPENFSGDCMLLQRRLRRFIELKGGEIIEHRDGSIMTEMAGDSNLTLYGGPKFFIGGPKFFIGSPSAYYGEIYWRRRLFCRRKSINEAGAQALYEELNIAIKEMEQDNKED